MVEVVLRGAIDGLELSLVIDAQPAELVINGDFSSSDGWSLYGGAAIDGGKLTLDGSGSGRAIRDAALFPAAYHYAFDVEATDGTELFRVTIGGASEVVPGSNAPGHFEGTLTIPASDQSVLIGVEDTVAVADNFSLKRVLA